MTVQTRKQSAPLVSPTTQPEHHESEALRLRALEDQVDEMETRMGAQFREVEIQFSRNRQRIEALEEENTRLATARVRIAAGEISYLICRRAKYYVFGTTPD